MRPHQKGIIQSANLQRQDSGAFRSTRSVESVDFQHLLDSVSERLITRPEKNAIISAPVVEDTRSVQPGSLFVARKGPNTDSHDLIGEAVKRGAVAVIGERPPEQVV